jgi:hypothetical protein
MKCRNSSNTGQVNYEYLLDCGVNDILKSLDSVKAKAELLDWLTKSELVHLDQIEFCDKCRDKGYYKVRTKRTAKGAAHSDFVFKTKPCPCLDNPLSVASIRKRNKK